MIFLRIFFLEMCKIKACSPQFNEESHYICFFVCIDTTAVFSYTLLLMLIDFFVCIFLGNDTLFAGNESVIVPMVYEARAVWGIVNANTDFLNRLQNDDYIKLSLFATFECFI